jgi:hypothetical protein
MPKGLPSPAQLWQGDVSFFSIDTDLIQAAGYDFDAGALNQLPNQLPGTMQLQLTEVVSEEIVRHRMKPVQEAIQQLTSACNTLRRLTAVPIGPIQQSFVALGVSEAAADSFRAQVRAYAERCRGGILSISGDKLAPDLFKLYFEDGAPFEKRQDKKSEFPDATSLLLLDQYAADNNTLGIVASADRGWQAYAEKSERLYAVKTVDELAALFAATTEHAKALKEKILAAVNDKGSALRAQVTEALQEHLADASWDASNIYSGSTSRVEAEVYDTKLTGYELAAEATNVWPVEGDPNTWIVELAAHLAVDVQVSVEFFIWDSIDRDEVGIGGDSYTIPMEIDVEAFLTCAEVQLDKGPEDWSIEAEIASGSYSVDEIEVEPDFSDRE